MSAAPGTATSAGNSLGRQRGDADSTPGSSTVEVLRAAGIRVILARPAREAAAQDMYK